MNNNEKKIINKVSKKKETFIKNLDNYKIYKMEEVYFAFPADEKVNFDEVDYALNDQVIKDYSIDAVETKIIEAR